ncbi:MAG: response regulator [bacterium]
MAKSSTKQVKKKTKPGAHVLIVEDDTFLSGMYITKLIMEHFEVELASDGEQALKSLRQRQPDIILLDILLPKKSGFEVLKEIRKSPQTKKIPVILLTNLGEKQDIRRGLDLGADDYLIKAHFLPSEVISKIKSLVEKKII